MGNSIKTHLKHFMKRTALWARHFVPTPPDSSRILTYHSVGYRPHPMNVSPEFFLAQMEWLAENQHVITLEEAAKGVSGTAITFDDGYRDNLLYAAPILERFGLSATVFIVAGRVGSRLDHDGEDTHAVLMDWSEISQIIEKGWSVGGHSMTHRRLTLCSDTELITEITESRNLLQQHLGIPIHSFAYPFGSILDYDIRCINQVKESGYSFAFTNRYGWNTKQADSWTLRRIWIDASDSFNSFQQKVLGEMDILCLMDSKPGIYIRRVLNKRLEVNRK